MADSGLSDLMHRLIIFFSLLAFTAIAHAQSTLPSCCMALPQRFGSTSTTLPSQEKDIQPGPPPNMIWIPGGEFAMGAADSDVDARPDERPTHRVSVGGFWIDK